MSYEFNGRGSIPTIGECFLFLYSVQTGSATNPTLYSLGAFGFLLECKEAECETDNSI
jgi:hypothetical protein